jgi:hypothetical protein
MPTTPDRPAQSAWDPMTNWLRYQRQLAGTPEIDAFPLVEPVDELPDDDELDLPPPTSRHAWAPAAAAILKATGITASLPVHEAPDAPLIEALREPDPLARYKVPPVAFCPGLDAQPDEEEPAVTPCATHEPERVLVDTAAERRAERNARDRAHRARTWLAHVARGGKLRGPRPRGA